MVFAHVPRSLIRREDPTLLHQRAQPAEGRPRQMDLVMRPNGLQYAEEEVFRHATQLYDITIRSTTSPTVLGQGIAGVQRVLPAAQRSKERQYHNAIRRPDEAELITLAFSTLGGQGPNVRRTLRAVAQHNAVKLMGVNASRAVLVAEQARQLNWLTRLLSITVHQLMVREWIIYRDRFLGAPPAPSTPAPRPPVTPARPPIVSAAPTPGKFGWSCALLWNFGRVARWLWLRASLVSLFAA